MIRGRFDLTLECIRRHNTGRASPLSETLDPHSDFFALFGDFRGYVEHFLLQDLVTGDFTSVRFMKDFADFSNDSLPGAGLTRSGGLTHCPIRLNLTERASVAV